MVYCMLSVVKMLAETSVLVGKYSDRSIIEFIVRRLNMSSSVEPDFLSSDISRLSRSMSVRCCWCLDL